MALEDTGTIPFGNKGSPKSEVKNKAWNSPLLERLVEQIVWYTQHTSPGQHVLCYLLCGDIVIGL